MSNGGDYDLWDTDALQRVYSYLMCISDYHYRIQHNDPSLTLLNVGFNTWRRSDYGAYFIPDSMSDWARLGSLVGSNSSLNTLCLDYGVSDDNGDDENMYGLSSSKGTLEHLQAFCDGLKHNRSIESFHIETSDLYGKGLFVTLGSFLEGNNALRRLTVNNDEDVDYDVQTDALQSLSWSLTRSNIAHLRFIECDMETEGIRMLCLGLKGCRTLKSLAIEGVNALKPWTGIDGEAMGELAHALEGHPGLVELSLNRNNLAINGGLACIEGLLQSRESKLEVLNLQDNLITSSQAKFLAESLVANMTLSTLDLSSNLIVDWSPFSRLLCNTTSIESTHKSNHTLQSLGPTRRRNIKLPTDLSCHLKLNSIGNEREVASHKILRHHFNAEFDMEPLADMSLAVMPSLLSWLGNGPGHRIYDKMDVRHNSALHYFLKNIPWLMLLHNQRQRN